MWEPAVGGEKPQLMEAWPEAPRPTAPPWAKVTWKWPGSAQKYQKWEPMRLSRVPVLLPACRGAGAVLLMDWAGTGSGPRQAKALTMAAKSSVRTRKR